MTCESCGSESAACHPLRNVRTRPSRWRVPVNWSERGKKTTIIKVHGISLSLPRPVSRQICCVQKAAGLNHVTTTTLRSGEEATLHQIPFCHSLSYPPKSTIICGREIRSASRRIAVPCTHHSSSPKPSQIAVLHFCFKFGRFVNLPGFLVHLRSGSDSFHWSSANLVGPGPQRLWFHPTVQTSTDLRPFGICAL